MINKAHENFGDVYASCEELFLGELNGTFCSMCYFGVGKKYEIEFAFKKSVRGGFDPKIRTVIL